MRLLGIIPVFGFLVLGLNPAVADPTTKSLHKQATELAFEDKFDESLAILRGILDREPKNYPVYRDYTVYTAWSGRCTKALGLYAKISANKNQEPYLITAMADCIAEKEGMNKGIAMLEKWEKRYPKDEDIGNALKDKRSELALNMKPTIDLSISGNNADLPNQPGAANADVFEYTYNLRYTHPVTEKLRAYGRYLFINSDDPAIVTEDLNRLGAGISYAISNQLTITEDLSQDTDGENGGSTTTIEYQPHSQWNTTLEYATYSEDIPLRALPNDTKTDRTSLSWFFHTPDYRYEWFNSISKYNFKTAVKEDNKRTSISTELSYGFELSDEREQRVGLELSHSTNSSDDPSIPYFNPERDFNYNLVYKMDLTIKSRFVKHIDHFSVFAGIYDQKASQPNVNGKTKFNDAIYGLGYEQEYQFDKKNSLIIGGAYSSRVYDGQREDQYEAHISLSRKL